MFKLPNRNCFGIKLVIFWCVMVIWTAANFGSGLVSICLSATQSETFEEISAFDFSDSLRAGLSQFLWKLWRFTVRCVGAGSWQKGFSADFCCFSCRIFSRVFCLRLFLSHFCGTSAQQNPPGKSPAKSLKIRKTKIPDTFLQRGRPRFVLRNSVPPARDTQEPWGYNLRGQCIKTPFWHTLAQFFVNSNALLAHFGTTLCEL